MRALTLASLIVFAAGPVAAAPLALPVHYPGDAVVAPCYAGDVLELQLAPRAARFAHPWGATPTRAGRVAVLGVASVDAAAAALGATFEPEFVGETAPEGFATGATDFTGYQVVHLRDGTRLEDALATFRALPDVASALPIAILPTSSFPNDSLFHAEHWLYRDVTPRHDMRAPEAWDLEQGDTSIVVAVLDTGVLPYHPDLGGTVPGGHGNIWINWAEAGGTPGVDDDGNGFVDDTWGWDFVSLSPGSGAVGEDVVDADNDPNDYAGHGTLVAGVVGAIANNVSGIAGVVPRVRLMAVRMGWVPPTGFRPNGAVRMDFAAQAVRYATRSGASVINCSWSSDYNAGLDAAVTAATRTGVVVVNASGNFGSPAYLGSRDDVLSVAATDSTDHYWSPSVTGPWLDLAADGVDVISTNVVSGVGSDSTSVRQPGYSGPIDGTSLASPQVAGAAAMLQAHRRALGLDPLTPMGLRLRLVETADDVRALNTTISDVAPRLNLLRALTDPPTSTAVRAGASSVGSALVLAYTTGHSRVVVATADRRLVAYDGETADTLWIATLAAAPVGSVAGGFLGAGLGVGIFVGGASGQVFGFRDDGTVLPGWPVTGLGAIQMSGGAALGDLDGDGALEVVAMGSNGRVWAWHSDGTKLAGFPFVTGIAGALAPAIADVDGQPGAEILVLDASATLQAGTLHAIDHTGTELWQWTAPSGAIAPVVTRLGHAGAPLGILVADPTGVTALDSTGTPVWNTPLAVTTIADPAFTDVDGDGVDELVLATGSPATLVRVDSAGVVTGVPFATGVDAQGPLVTGPLRAGHGVCTGFYSAAGFVALDESGQAVPAFPRPVPSAGAFPTLADLRGDGATQVVAGTAADSSFCVFDAGRGTFDSRYVIWPTPRGNGARTGNRAYSASPARIDRTPPAVVADLRVTALADTVVTLTWTACGDNASVGRPARYEIAGDTAPVDSAGFDAARVQVSMNATVDAGGTESVVVPGLTRGRHWFFVLRAVGSMGGRSRLSNVATVLVPVGGALRGRSGVAVAARPSPSRVPVAIDWQGVDDGGTSPQSLAIHDLAGRVVRRVPLGAGPGGTWNWDGRDGDSRLIPAGLYLVRLSSGGRHADARILLLR